MSEELENLILDIQYQARHIGTEFDWDFFVETAQKARELAYEESRDE